MQSSPTDPTTDFNILYIQRPYLRHWNVHPNKTADAQNLYLSASAVIRNESLHRTVWNLMRVADYQVQSRLNCRGYSHLMVWKKIVHSGKSTNLAWNICCNAQRWELCTNDALVKQSHAVFLKYFCHFYRANSIWRFTNFNGKFPKTFSKSITLLCLDNGAAKLTVYFCKPLDKDRTYQNHCFLWKSNENVILHRELSSSWPPAKQAH